MIGADEVTVTYQRVAVVVPCHNEERTIGEVVDGFRAALPGCAVVVADNRSTDDTARVAREHGAQVASESRPGKGFAVRRLLADVEADCYVMVDGDATYDPAAAPEMVGLVLDHGVDMVNGARVVGADVSEAYRPGHGFGNAMLTWIFAKLFRLELRDTLSGYRVMSRRFVKSFPTGAEGFEIEAELNAHAATLGVPIAEVDTAYSARPEGSESKLNTYRDGVRILRRNLQLFRDARPALAFLLLSLPWLLVAAGLLWVAGAEYLRTGLVQHFPSLIAGVGALVLGGLIILTGLMLARVARNRVEANRLCYLEYPAPTPLGVLGPTPLGVQGPTPMGVVPAAPLGVPGRAAELRPVDADPRAVSPHDQ